MKGKRIVVGPRRTRYAPVRSREPLSTPRVAGGGIYETDAAERLDAASRREERHRSFEENRETFEVVPIGRLSRVMRKLRRKGKKR